RSGIYTNGDGTINQGAGVAGGAGTVYWKKSSDALGELVVNNGGVNNSAAWSTPIKATNAIGLTTLTIGGSAHVDVTNLVTVTGQTVVTGADALRVVNGSALGDVVLSQANRLD